MIELGVGFHPELTGWENVRASAALLGHSRSGMEATCDRVAAFGGIADAMDRPLKHYSAGMQARLAVALMTDEPADLLAVDEVLATGDRDFQIACLERIHSLVEGGTSLVFVSHELPLVAQARDWKHGVFIGATISSEKTAAAEGTVGELRRDPFAMLPFCGYNMADYFGHWLKVGQKLRFDRAPRIFQVNWFRKGTDGRFLWPGFGDNARVIDWIIRRLDNEVGAVESPIGRLPRTEDLDLDGIDVPQADLDELFAIDPALWLHEADLTEEFYRTFDGRVPAPLWAELAALRYRLQRA